MKASSPRARELRLVVGVNYLRMFYGGRKYGGTDITHTDPRQLLDLCHGVGMSCSLKQFLHRHNLQGRYVVITFRMAVLMNWV